MKKILLLLTTLTALFSMTQKTEVISIKGEVGVYGSMPHTFVAIKDTQNNTIYRVHNYKDFNLTKMQNEIVEAKALLLNKSKIFKNVQLVELLELKRKP